MKNPFASIFRQNPEPTRSGESLRRAMAATMALAAFASESMAIDPRAFQGIVSALHIQAQATGEGTANGYWDDIQDPSTPPYQVVNGVAVIPIHGPMVRIASWWQRYLGYCSSDETADIILQADADTAVTKIVLHFRTPGGLADAAAMLAEVVASVRDAGNTTIESYCELCCSAGYWVASQTQRIVAYRVAPVGCIGSRQTVMDTSAMYAQMGIKAVVATTGQFKLTGIPGVPVTKEMQADMLRECQETQEVFDADLLTGRGWSQAELDAVKDGRTYIGQHAKRMKLVDEVGSIDVAINAAAQTASDGTDPADDGTTSNTVPGNRTPGDSAQTTAAERSGQEKPNMAFWDELKAVFQKNGVKVDDESPVTTPAPAPVATTTSAPTTENEELTRLRAFHSSALTEAKTAAKAAAVTAFGQGDDRLARANAAIDRLTDVAAVKDLASAYEAMTPAELQQGGTATTRQTATDDPAERPSAPITITDEDIQAARKQGERLQSAGAGRAVVVAARK